MTGSAKSGHASGDRPLPLYPALVTIAWVINTWAMAALAPQAAFRTLVVAMIAVTLLLGLMRVVLGDWHRAAFATGLVAIALSRDPVRIIELAARMETWQALLWLALVILTLAYATILLRRVLRRSWAPLTRGLNVFSTSLLAVVCVSAFASGALAEAQRDFEQGRADLTKLTGATEVARPGTSYPDIYVILLDGYPRADTLQEMYGFDNAPFLEALEEHGFDVAARSRSNYMFTQLTLLTMFDMRHITDASFEGMVSTFEVNAALRRGLDKTRGLDALRQHGYEIVASASGFESVALRKADVYLDDGQLNEFERHVLRRTLIVDILSIVAPDWLPGDHRARLASNFEHLRRIVATPSSAPRFAFIHIAAPHTPFLYQADGSPAPRMSLREFYRHTPLLMGLSREDFNRKLSGYVAYLNGLTLAAVEDILGRSARPPVIIVMSDHGSETEVHYGDPHHPSSEERFLNLFAAYTPGHGDLFPEWATPINVLPILMNTYLGTDHPCSADRTFANGPTGYLDLHEIPNPDAGGNYPCGAPLEEARAEPGAGRVDEPSG